MIARDADDTGVGTAAARQALLGYHKVQRPELWTNLVEEAEYHGVVPLLAPMISALAKETPEIIPDYVRRAFVALTSRHRRAAGIREKCVDQLLAAFASAGVPIILLKGTALAHLIYSAPELRPMIDIDILIDPTDGDLAVRTVRSLDYYFEPRHGSRFAGRMHHLPAAITARSGFEVSLEIHFDALSRDQSGELTFETLSTKPRPFVRGAGPQGLALGHADMLWHLVCHLFEPTRCVPLKHLYDLWLYQKLFAGEIDWCELEKRFPQVIIGLQLVSQVFSSFGNSISSESKEITTGRGAGMAPLSEIAKMPFPAKLISLFNPSPWWLHGYYGIPLERSLLFCRTIRHPVTLARWFARRLKAGILPPPPYNLNDNVRE